MVRELDTEVIDFIAEQFVTYLYAPRQETTVTVDLADSAISITGYFDGCLYEEGDNLYSPYYSVYQSITMSITDYEWAGENGVKYTLSKRDLDEITKTIERRLS